MLIKLSDNIQMVLRFCLFSTVTSLYRPIVCMFSISKFIFLSYDMLVFCLFSTVTSLYRPIVCMFSISKFIFLSYDMLVFYIAL